MADNVDTTINCPACGKPMKKIYMPEQGVNLDVCVDGCGGIYFDNREFSKFDEPHEDITPLTEILKGKEFEKVDEGITRVCPVCGADMVKNYSGANKETVVDECYHCGGKFLDYKELDKIRSEYNTEAERSSEAINLLYREVGSKLVERPGINKLYNQKKGKTAGLVIGFIFAAAWLIAKWGVLSAHFNNSGNSVEFWFVVGIAVAIMCLFIGIGSIIGRKLK